ncbi:MAG TPA: hypothetical protein VGK71_08125 [Nitrospirota bacterium]
MRVLIRVSILLAAVVMLSACAPTMKVVVNPIPADTTPAKVLEMVKAKEAGITAMKASVRIRIEPKDKPESLFDGVFYAAKPSRYRLTANAFLGFTLFDVVLDGDKFYFYQPSDGWLYTGPRAKFKGFLLEKGVNIDPETLFRSVFVGEPDSDYKYLVERGRAGDTYQIYTIKGGEGPFLPKVKGEYDLGLNLLRHTFYDDMSFPYMFVDVDGFQNVTGYQLPQKLKVENRKDRYNAVITFYRYIINPETAPTDFTIQGGELKGIRTVE